MENQDLIHIITFTLYAGFLLGLFKKKGKVEA